MPTETLARVIFFFLCHLEHEYQSHRAGVLCSSIAYRPPFTAFQLHPYIAPSTKYLIPQVYSGGVWAVVITPCT